MASADRLRINVHGRQTHASMPWRGVDPVVTSAQIILALQTIVTRQINSTTTPAVLSISTIHGGVRSNILPDDVTMEGTLRVHDEAVRADIKRRITKTATTIADAGGATAEVEIGEGVPVTYNDPALTRWGTRSLGDGVRRAGDGVAPGDGRRGFLASRQGRPRHVLLPWRHAAG